MPELPEVETVRRGLAPAMEGERFDKVEVRRGDLRWPLPRGFAQKLHGKLVEGLGRRAKYLLADLSSGDVLLMHLGMSGSFRVGKNSTPGTYYHERSKSTAHDHIVFHMSNGKTVTFNDPRRFGSLHYVEGDPLTHKLLARLAPEPLEADFNTDYLWRITRKRRVPIKQLLMDGHRVVGVGNIYANEALFRARVKPTRRASGITQAEAAALVRAVRATLRMAIRVGGTTLRDYVGADGAPGYFRQRLHVYEREGRACRRCGALIRQLTQGHRSTYYCPQCQKS